MVWHILNGDALREKFPAQLSGEVLVAREALVDGEVHGDTLEALLQTRAQFISQHYPGYSQADYYAQTAPEFRKIAALPADAAINLWFEYDLFCQVNCWFVLHLLAQSGHQFELHLVMPPENAPHGFGSLDETGLIAAFEKRFRIEPDAFQHLGQFWAKYQQMDFAGMIELTHLLGPQYAYLHPVIEAQIARFPADGSTDRITSSLMQIMDELQTLDFGPVFREFCKREPIYGLGDLQVHRIWKEIVES